MNPLDRPVLSALTIFALVVLIGLGTWQAKKVPWKADLIASIEARTTAPAVLLPSDLTQVSDYSHVQVTGQFAPGERAFVNGTYEGVPGWYVFEAFVADETTDQPLLVNRGFVTADQRREAEISDSPSGVTTITALVRSYTEPSPMARLFIAPASPDKGEYYSRSPELLHQHFAVTRSLTSPSPVYLELWPDNGEQASPRAGTTRIEFHEKHLGYAITWFGLAIGLLFVYGVMMRRSAQSRARGN